MFHIEILNKGALRSLERDLRKVANDLAGGSNLRRPFERIRDEVAIPSIDQNFARQGRPKKWPPIDTDTIAWRARTRGMSGISRGAILRAVGEGAFTGSILIHTGKGRKAATAKARFHIRENTMTYGDWPPTTWYMQVHDIEQFARAAGIPHRQFAMWQPEDEFACGEILMEWVEQTVERNMRRVYV